MPKRLPYEIQILGTLALGSCDRPAWEDKLDVVDVNARNAIYRVNRWKAEQGFGRLKRFKRVALRCEKTADNFRSIVSFAAGLCLIKFVRTA